MKKFTFISEYRGGTFISQYRALDLIKALQIWGNKLDVNVYNRKDILQIQNEVSNIDNFPTLVKTVETV